MDHRDLVDVPFDQMIEDTFNVSFLIAVLYRKGRYLPDSLSTGLDPDVLAHAKTCSMGDVPGGDYFRRPYTSWLNRLGDEKRWMFFVHQGVYGVNGLTESGVLVDPVQSYYDRERPRRHDPRYPHILDQDLFRLKNVFSPLVSYYEKCATNVREDLVHNLIALQSAQARIISPYLGESEGFIQPQILAEAVRLAMNVTDELHQWEIKDWLPSAVLKATEVCVLDSGEWYGRKHLYFDI